MGGRSDSLAGRRLRLASGGQLLLGAAGQRAWRSVTRGEIPMLALAELLLLRLLCCAVRAGVRGPIKGSNGVCPELSLGDGLHAHSARPISPYYHIVSGE